MSGYAREALVGTAHNLIRHPEMPRIIFKLLWEEIEASRPFAGYVKNLANDGRHYWVMACIVPCTGGYLSIRIKPSSPLFATAQAVYAALLALERETEGGDPHRREQAMEASRVVLADRLQAAGFSSYTAFMCAALLAEVRQREANVGMAHAAILHRQPRTDPALRAILCLHPAGCLSRRLNWEA